MSTTIDTILKLSGHKNMKSFYKEFPDEASFMDKHGGQFKKAMRGARIKKAQGGQTMTPITPISTQQGWNNYYETLPTGTEKLDDMGQGFDLAGMVAPGMKVVENVIKGFQQLKDEKRALQKAKQWSKVSDVNLQASQLTPEPIERKYTRPEDIINTGDKFFPVYGVGTDALAKKGKKIKKANFGTQVGSVLQGIGSDRLTNLAVGMSGGESAGATFGGAAGDIISMIPGVGPIVGTLAKPVLSAVGNLIDTNPEKTKRYQDRFEGNINQMAMGKGMQGLFNTNNAYMASGGNVSNMETEGELRIGRGGAKSLSYNPFLPDGGETIEFTGPSHAEGGMPVAYGRNPVEVEGGEPAVKLQSGGTDEDLVVFGDLTVPGRNKKFKSVVKDIAKEEAKQNKKAEKALLSIEDLSPTTPFDKLKLNSAKATLMGTTQKLKAYASEKQSLASLQEAINQTAKEMNIDANALSKGNIKMAKKGTSISKAQNGDTKPKGGSDALWSALAGPPYMLARGARALESLLAKKKRENLNNPDEPLYMYPGSSGYPLDEVGEQTAYDFNVRNTPSILKGDWTENPASRYNLPPYWKYLLGRHIPDTKFNAPRSYREQNYIYGPESTAPIVDFGVKSQPSVVTPIDNTGSGSTTSSPATPTSQTPVSAPQTPTAKTKVVVDDKGFTGPPTLEDMLAATKEYVVPTYGGKEDDKEETTDSEEKKKGWEYAIDALNTYLPYFRPSDTERLDPRQLMGEMFALTDKEEPVQAQTFQPQLRSPYSVSFADQKNDVIAQVRSAQRMAGNNPAAQAMIASQAIQALNKINAEEFRMNQGMADKVYGENTATMNQAQLQNLQILDNQYTRQQQAKSNTKARLQAALNSISDKYLKNELNNRTLATYENLYNYRFDDRGRKQNWNAPYQWNMEGDTYAGTSGREGLPTGYEYVYNSRGERIDVRRIPKTSISVGDDDNKVKNGGNIARAIKSL